MKVPSIFKYSRSRKWNYSVSRLKNLETATSQINLPKHFSNWVNTNNNIFCYVSVMSRFFPFKMSFGIFNDVSSLGICLLFIAFFVLLCYLHIERLNVLWDSVSCYKTDCMFLDGAPSIYHFFGHLSVRPSICPSIFLSFCLSQPYLGNCTSSDHNFLYTW